LAEGDDNVLVDLGNRGNVWRVGRVGREGREMEAVLLEKADPEGRGMSLEEEAEGRAGRELGSLGRDRGDRVAVEDDMEGRAGILGRDGAEGRDRVEVEVDSAAGVDSSGA
jgi:hypothetical protein